MIRINTDRKLETILQTSVFYVKLTNYRINLDVHVYVHMYINLVDIRNLKNYNHSIYNKIY